MQYKKEVALCEKSMVHGSVHSFQELVYKTVGFSVDRWVTTDVISQETSRASTLDDLDRQSFAVCHVYYQFIVFLFTVSSLINIMTSKCVFTHMYWNKGMHFFKEYLLSDCKKPSLVENHTTYSYNFKIKLAIQKKLSIST